MRENGLNISVSMTEAIELTTKQRYRRTQFVLQEEPLKLKRQIQYLGIEPITTISFNEHIY